MILKEMLFGEQTGAREKELAKNEKREPFGSAQGKVAPHSKTQLSMNVSITQIKELSNAILSCSYLVGLERVRGESGNAMEITPEGMGRSLWHRWQGGPTPLLRWPCAKSKRPSDLVEGPSWLRVSFAVRR